jgi:hypothetical protein
MKKSLLAIALLFVCGYAFAAVGLYIDSTPYGSITDVKCSSSGTVRCSFDGSTLTFN